MAEKCNCPDDQCLLGDHPACRWKDYNPSHSFTEGMDFGGDSVPIINPVYKSEKTKSKAWESWENYTKNCPNNSTPNPHSYVVGYNQALKEEFKPIMPPHPPDRSIELLIWYTGLPEGKAKTLYDNFLRERSLKNDPNNLITIVPKIPLAPYPVLMDKKTYDQVIGAQNELLKQFCEFMESDGYLDTDWRTEEPFAIDKFNQFLRKPK